MLNDSIGNLKESMKRATRRKDEKNQVRKRMKYILTCHFGNKEEFLKSFRYWYVYKNTASPCNCWMCQGEKYSRKIKHKKMRENDYYFALISQ